MKEKNGFKYSKMKWFQWVIFGFVLLVWSSNLLLLNYENRGSFGDMFGAVNALFSGLAFAGLYISIQLQQEQINQIENETEKRRETEITTETLAKCEYYFTEIQLAFKELIQNEAYSGMPIEWSGLKKVSRKSLEEFSSSIFTKFSSSEGKLKNQSLITLYKLEALAAIFLNSNIDLELGRKMIGRIYCTQVGFLIGLIAYYRPEGSEELFENTLKLKDRWTAAEKLPVNPIIIPSKQ